MEHLLKKRYKVINDYPYSLYAIGDIVEEHEEDKFHYLNDGSYQYASSQTLDKFPHLFKNLKWWEDRNEKELIPLYVKHIQSGKVYHIKYFNKSEPKAYDFNMKHLNLNKCIPVSKQEYLKSKTK